MCPRCPLRYLVSEVRRESWLKIPNGEADLKLCMRLRAMSANNPRLPECPHYPRTEDLARFIGPTVTRVQKKEEFEAYEQRRLLE